MRVAAVHTAGRRAEAPANFSGGATMHDHQPFSRLGPTSKKRVIETGSSCGSPRTDPVRDHLDPMLEPALRLALASASVNSVGAWTRRAPFHTNASLMVHRRSFEPHDVASQSVHIIFFSIETSVPHGHAERIAVVMRGFEDSGRQHMFGSRFGQGSRRHIRWGQRCIEMLRPSLPPGTGPPARS